MTPCLARGLEDPGVRSFLTLAVERDDPNLDDLVAAGIPHYRAGELRRRLEASGELGPAGWAAEARLAYRTLLSAPVTAVAAASRPLGRLQQLPESERPREKAREQGVGALSNAELLAVLLRTGTAQEGVLELAERLLCEHDGLPGLAGATVTELSARHGLGEAKAGELAAAFELARRLARASRRERPALRDPEAVVAVLAADLAGLDHERFLCLPLDARLRLIGEPRTVSVGDVDGTEAGARAFFRTALRAGAAQAIAVHNHPSGDPGPSAGDRAVTRALAAAGRLVGIPLADHLVLGLGGRCTSLRRVDPGLWS